jgi:hypothetical protein
VSEPKPSYQEHCDYFQDARHHYLPCRHKRDGNRPSRLTKSAAAPGHWQTKTRETAARHRLTRLVRHWIARCHFFSSSFRSSS